MAKKKSLSSSDPVREGAEAAVSAQYQIENIDIGKVIPYAKNAKLHTDEQVSEIMASFTEFGFINPVLLDGGNVIVAGHGRFKAAQRLGLQTIPYINVGRLSPAKIKALRIVDNQLNLKTGWNADLLSLELTELADDNYNMELLGFGEQLDEWLTAGADDPVEPDDEGSGGGSSTPPPPDGSSSSEDELIRGDVERMVLIVNKGDFLKAARVITEVKASEGLENVTEVFLHLLWEWDRQFGSRSSKIVEDDGASDAPH